MVKSLATSISEITQDIASSNSQELVIDNLVNIIRSWDPGTGDHSERTQMYTRFLINKIFVHHLYPDELTSEKGEQICKAAAIHDIGKLAVDDAILSKPTRLTDEEYLKIKDHTAAGSEIIRTVLSSFDDKNFVEIAAAITRHHHEHWDGTGYPDGLSGRAIPLCARILKIADVFDALTSQRSYKESMNTDQALKIMMDTEGHFEPLLLQVFSEERAELEEIRISLLSD